MPTLEVSTETYEKIKDQLGEEEVTELDDLDDLVGKKLFIRTVTYHLLGKVHARVGNFLHMKEACWVSDSGRFMQFIKKGEWSASSEREPVGEVYVNLGSVTDMFPWKHSLPKDQK